MYNYNVSFFFGVVAMCMATLSYFQKSKTGYLLLQILNITALVLSYLFLEEFFAMVSYLVSFLRVAVFFLYEKRDKEVSLAMKLLFVGLAMVRKIRSCTSSVS